MTVAVYRANSHVLHLTPGSVFESDDPWYSTFADAGYLTRIDTPTAPVVEDAVLEVDQLDVEPSDVEEPRERTRKKSN